MHGLINSTIAAFLRDSYGDDALAATAARAEIDPGGFEPFRSCPERLTLRLIAAAAETLGKPEPEFLEDLGAWLARVEPARRLLRFSGSDLADFLISLEELPGRAQLVLPQFAIPRIAVSDLGGGCFRVAVSHGPAEWRSVIAGMIRAMSDDYGALALIVDEGDAIAVDVSDESFGAARSFDLAPAHPRGQTARAS
ncbi:MAG: heme NO-binding domain-containing protein [Geminicoccaceae bacterium]|nr:heme NO-binding domain-containing protein [Geminicoccaceae bacterium]